MRKVDALQPKNESLYSDKSRGLTREFACGSGRFTFFTEDAYQHLLKQGYSLGREYDIYNEEAGENIRNKSNASAISTLDKTYGQGNWALAIVKSNTSEEKAYQVVFK